MPPSATSPRPTRWRACWPIFAPSARARDAIEREALDALIRFVERPSEIRVALEPVRPVPLLAMGLQFLGGRSFAKDAFGLKFSAR